MGLIDIIFIPLVIIVGHIIIKVTVNRFKLIYYQPLLVKLLYYHLAFAILFGSYVNIYGGDAVGYWRSLEKFDSEGFSIFEFHQPGTLFVRLLTYPFVHILKLSFWSGSLMFSLFGFLGFVFIFLTIVKSIKGNPTLFGIKLFPMILFLPNMHFWSAGIGKDSIIFFALALFIFSLTSPKRNLIGLFISLYLAFYIRPHIALLMIVGLGFSMVTSLKGLAFFWRIIFLAISIFLFVLISPAVFEFIQIDANEIEQLDDLSEIRSGNLSRAKVGSAIDIGHLPIPLKILTFLFRPLFFDAPNILGIIVSLENLFYLMLAFTMFRFQSIIALFTLPTALKAAIFILGSTAFFMSSSLSNLGIIIRQKNMVMFMFVIVMTYLISIRYENDSRKYNRPSNSRFRKKNSPNE